MFCIISQEQTGVFKQFKRHIEGNSTGFMYIPYLSDTNIPKMLLDQENPQNYTFLPLKYPLILTYVTLIISYRCGILGFVVSLDR